MAKPIMVTKAHCDPPAPQTSLRDRIPSLDGLRAISIALVFLAHIAGTNGAPQVVERLAHIGNIGVRVFFVISGFLITTLLLKEHGRTGRISLKGFYIRRAIRIFPAFYAYIGVSIVLYLCGFVVLRNNDLLHAATYTMNYHDNRAWQLNHLWSLAVEEQFYLLWPVLMCVLGSRRALLWAGAAILLAPACRALMWYELDATPTAMTRRFQAVADALAMGCVLAGCYRHLGAVKWYTSFLASRWFLLVPALGILLAGLTASHSRGLYYTLGGSVCNVAIALCLDRYVRYPATLGGRLLNSSPLVFVGALSYSLYLWQEPFLNPMDIEPSYGSFLTTFPQNIFFAVIMALISYYLVERPFLRLKHRPPSTNAEPAPQSDQKQSAVLMESQATRE